MSKKMKRKERVRRINAESKGEIIDEKPKEDYMDSLLGKPLQENDQGFSGSGLSRKSRVRQMQYEGLVDSATSLNSTPMFVYLLLIFLFLAAVVLLYIWLE
mgnify:CR=1 FL=1